MELFIRIQDGQPFEHPIFGENFRQAFPHVDTGNLPPEFARFTRVEIPVVGVHEVYEGVTYEREGTIFKDVHHVRPMTDDEKLEKDAFIKNQEAQSDFVSLVFDKTTDTVAPKNS